MDSPPTNSSNVTSSEVDGRIIAQFKLILLLVLCGLIIFLGFLVYNLIKCYLPKWRSENKRRLQEEVLASSYNNPTFDETNKGQNIEL